MTKRQEQAVRAVETEARDFVAYVDRQIAHAKNRGAHSHPFAPRTLKHVGALRDFISGLEKPPAARGRKRP